MVPEVTYLGISLSQTRVTGTKLVDRMKRANVAVYQLRKLGVFEKRLSAKKCMRVYNALMQRRWDVCPAPHPSDASRSSSGQGSRANILLPGRRPGSMGTRDRLRLLCRLQAVEHRR